jgi:glutathione reductase (NADPH)
VVFVGGGVIALEFSHVYARAGTKVTFSKSSRLPPEREGCGRADPRRERAHRRRVHTGVKVARRKPAISCAQCSCHGKESVVSDRVVNGAGRIANVDYLDLEAGGVAHAGFRLAVDDYLRSASTPPSMRAATFYPARRNSRPSPPTKGSSSAATSSRGRSTSPSMRAFRPPSTPCRHWRAG